MANSNIDKVNKRGQRPSHSSADNSIDMSDNENLETRLSAKVSRNDALTSPTLKVQSTLSVPTLTRTSYTRVVKKRDTSDPSTSSKEMVQVSDEDNSTISRNDNNQGVNSHKEDGDISSQRGFSPSSKKSSKSSSRTALPGGSPESSDSMFDDMEDDDITDQQPMRGTHHAFDENEDEILARERYEEIMRERGENISENPMDAGDRYGRREYMDDEDLETAARARVSSPIDNVIGVDARSSRTRNTDREEWSGGYDFSGGSSGMYSNEYSDDSQGSYGNAPGSEYNSYGNESYGNEYEDDDDYGSPQRRSAAEIYAQKHQFDEDSLDNPSTGVPSGFQNAFDLVMELLNVISTAKAPLTKPNQVRLEKEPLISALKELESILPIQLRRASELMRESEHRLEDARKKADAITAQARQSADQIVNEANGSAKGIREDARNEARKIVAAAQQEAQHLVDNEVIVERAKEKAQTMVSTAQQKVTKLVSGANEYSLATLNSLLKQLSKIGNDVQAGVDVLQRRQEEIENHQSVSFEVPHLGEDKFGDES